MANQGKQEVSVETKAQEIQPAATDLWLRPYAEFERFFERMLGREWRKPFNWGLPAWGELMGLPEARLPSIDVLDQDDHIVVRAEIPGVDKNDLNVSINGNVLSIKGETKREEKREDGNYFRHEISRGAFFRSVTLPSNADASKANAVLTDGVLEVTVGKAGGAQGRSIKVQ